MAEDCGSIFRLRCFVQNYPWGKFGLDSEVARLLQNADDSFTVNTEAPYAELWMGTHSKGPSTISETGELLSDWISAHPQCLGSKLNGNLTVDLPFLFKVLSVRVSLSIQAHPCKPHAEQLHLLQPEHYPDSNHKPEMAIALTYFECLCGFRPKDEIINFFQVVPELSDIIGKPLIDQLVSATNDEMVKTALKACFTALMTEDSTTIKNHLSSLISRIRSIGSSSDISTSCLAELLLRVYDQFPDDVGCFCIYFLNYLTLEPGQAIFLEANLPHAYLSGDCLECMSCSDNVVRAGFTPKYKDVNTLCSMLNYQPREAAANLFNSSKSGPYVTVYDPPIPEFAVHKIELLTDVHEYDIQPLDAASIIIIIQGEGQLINSAVGVESVHVKRGDVMFVSANTKCHVSKASGSNVLLLYRAVSC